MLSKFRHDHFAGHLDETFTLFFVRSIGKRDILIHQDIAQGQVGHISAKLLFDLFTQCRHELLRFLSALELVGDQGACLSKDPGQTVGVRFFLKVVDDELNVIVTLKVAEENIVVQDSPQESTVKRRNVLVHQVLQEVIDACFREDRLAVAMVARVGDNRDQFRVKFDCVRSHFLRLDVHVLQFD